MPQWGDVGGINEGYLLELYEKFQQDPASVDPITRAAFEQFPPEFAEIPAAAPAAAMPPVPPAPDAASIAPRAGAGHPLASAQPVTRVDAPVTASLLHKIVGAVNLAESIRKYGHLGAQL